MAAFPLRGLALVVGLGLASGTTAAQGYNECQYRDCLSGVEIAAVNAGVTGALALARGAVAGRVRSWSDAAKVAGVGAGGGLGFALAKREAGAGRTLRGLAVLYGTASVVENVAEGDHPLARVRVGWGPADVRVRTPLARLPGAALGVEIEPAAAAALVVLPLAGFHADLSDGTLVWAAPGEIRVGAFGPIGLAVGRSVVLSGYNRFDREIRRHEVIHTFQSRQVGAVAPFGTVGALVPALRRTSFGGRVSWDVRTGLPTGVLSGLVAASQPYDQRYFEREAYDLEQP